MKRTPSSRARRLAIFRAPLFRHASNVFILVALLAGGYCSFLLISGQLYQAQETRRFVAQRPPGENPAPDTRHHFEKGSAVALLAIPRLGLSVLVVEGAADRELRLGPGHIPGTSLPGEGGNVGVAGHRDTFFRPLRLIRKGDSVSVSTHEGRYQYKVVSTEIVTPDDVQVLHPKGHETLTLVTCYPFDFVGPAPKRFIVQADCVDCLWAKANPNRRDGR